MALSTRGYKTADERGLDIKSLVYLAVRWKEAAGQLDEITYKPFSQSQIFIYVSSEYNLDLPSLIFGFSLT